MSLIEVVSLHQRFGERDVLKDINLKIERGEVFALLGPTGAGKTTLLRLIDLLSVPASGRVYFDGTDVTEPAGKRLEVRRRMAFVLQKPVVFNASVYDNIACGLQWRGEGKAKTREKVNNILDVVGLSAFSNKNARTLSGGEAQRVAIARAIVIEPEVLLLDEPTANLDPVSTAKIEGLISHIIRQYHTTIVMSTHDLSQGQRLADRIGVLLNGEMAQIGAVAEVFSSPKNWEVAQFVGIENIIDGVITSEEEGVATIDVDGSIVQAVSSYAVGERVSVCIRPEDITLAVAKTASSARNSFMGRITRVVSVGPLTRVVIDCGFPLVALVTKRSAEELNLGSGKDIYAAFKATGVHVVKRD